uniref:beta strand repeat-containing protein n=1 Tax=Eubacterium sp. TaxID=142586 RepID=UPI002582665D
MKKKKRVLKRILSFVLAVNLIIANVCFDGIFPFDRLFNTSLTVKAYSPVTTDENDAKFNADANGEVIITSLSILKDYAYHYSNSETFADKHEDDHIKLTLGASEYTIDSDYTPLGTSDHPFNGQLLFTTVNSVYTLQTYVPLFDYITDDAVIGGSVTLNLYNQATDHVLLANHVHHGSGTAVWNLYLDDNSIVDYGSSASYSGVIGEMLSNAYVSLNITDNSSTAVSNSSGDAGMICGTMQSGSKISLSLTRTSTDAFDVSSTLGNAGALVGTMHSGSSVELVKIPEASASSTVTAASDGYYAGGLVGQAEDASVVITTGGMTVGSTAGVTIIPVEGTVTASTGGAGGLFGHYINSETTFDLKDYDITATVYAKYCGGVFGVLENNKGGGSAIALTIKNTSNTGTISTSSGTESTGYYGGIAGKYTTDALTNSLILDGFSVSSTANASFDSFGGVIGIADSAAYVKVDGLTVNSTNADKKDSDSFYGGLIGKTSVNNGVFVDLGSFTLIAPNFKGGGVVGSFKKGVLRLSGVTDMSAAKAARGGQLIGENDNVLTYALGTGSNGTAYESGWTFTRSNGSQVDDLGTWGEVVRVANIEDNNSGILVLDSSAHTVTVEAAKTSMGTAADFAKTALNIQLNQGGNYDCLKFTSGSENTRDTLLASDSLSLSADISLAGTGITGFMRDGSPTISRTDTGSVGIFTGTLDGNGHKITLAVGEAYGRASDGVNLASGEGSGAIYGHLYNGLFSVIGDGSSKGTVKDLTINGIITVRNAGKAGMSIGGVAARSHGSTEFDGITVKQRIDHYASTSGNDFCDSEDKDEKVKYSAWGKQIGGLIGVVDNNSDGNGTIDIIGTTVLDANFVFRNTLKNWVMCGGAIGNVDSHTVTINVATNSGDRCTVSSEVNTSNVTSKDSASCIAGLIAYIGGRGDYKSKVVNIKNLEFDGCTISNPATSSAGGLLGYTWLRTTANIDGVTVTDATLDYADNTSLGAMAYDATGVWTVDNLSIDKLTVSQASASSLGMIVNSAYKDNEGLYLNVLNSGYKLTDKSGETGITLPSTLVVYDELAAYSASNVINGGNGAGVVSINMNSNRSSSEAKTTVTGTYQNQLTSASSTALTSAKYANDKSRYYYNLDRMSSSNVGQNLVLWSVYKYAASNISGEFMHTNEHPFGTTFDSTLSGNADLTGLSFYPVANAENVELSGLNVTFDYSGIYATAEAVSNSDSYIRDPGVANQHYLMHSGLFINVPAGKTVTVTGSSSIGGNFLEVGDYKAALISKTMKGNLKVTGSLELKGLTPRTTGNAAYNQGYLLVNKISRPDSQTATVTLELNNISTSDYSSTSQTPVAKSLIGPADGRSLKFKFSGIKLDARKAAVSDTDVSGVNAALTAAYGTSRSIFSDATLILSINTDQYADLVYNYTRDEDWGSGSRNVTYGNEITGSLEYPGQEKKYYGDPRNFTRPDADSNTEYTFSDTDFLPYVGVPYDPNADHTGKYYREIKVNVVTEVEWEGCGTYNDPYIINDGEQLESLSAFLQSGKASDIGSIILPIYDSSKFNGIANNTTGDRWCTDKTGNTYHVLYSNNGDTEFTASGYSSWSAENAQYYLASAYYKISGNIELGSDFMGLGGTTANTAFRGVIVGEKDVAGVPAYTIENKTEKPFIWVSNGSVIKDVNFEVNSNVDLSQGNNGYNNAYFGYNHTTTPSVCRFYGGIIGEIMGGDNIIDNSYVTFENGSKITLNGNNGTIVPVGGYVGVVVFGGLIFKNMDARKTTAESTRLNVIYTGKNENLADNDGQEDWAAIYVNPIVGRVINGYAVNETGGNAKNSSGETFNQFSVTENGKYHNEGRTARSAATVQHTLKNGAKHYSIADIDPYYGKTAEQWNELTDEEKDALRLDVTPPESTSADGTINVPNAQAMFILSLITQSTSGTAQTANGAYQNSLSYGINKISNVDTVYGMSHNADYSDVGTNDALAADDPETENVDETTVSDYQKLAVEDTAANTAVPYIIRRYTVPQEPYDVTYLDEYIKYSGEPSSLNGKSFYISNNRGTENYMKDSTTDNNPTKLSKTSNVDEAPLWYFEIVPNTTNVYKLYTKNGDQKNYMCMDTSCNMSISNSDGSEFTIEAYGSGYHIYNLNGTTKNGINQHGSTNGKGFAGWSGKDDGSRLLLTTKIPGRTVTVTGYSARCVTSTLGFYDINLTGSNYVLPDSFRGLGSVGLYDSISPGNNTQVEPEEAVGGKKNNGTTDGWNNRATNKFSIKLDQFNGNSQIIDVDIYLNKFL